MQRGGTINTVMKNNISIELQSYLDKGHVRYMPETVKRELAALVPACSGTPVEQLFWVMNGLTTYPSCEGCGVSLTSRQWKPFLTVKQRRDDRTSGYMRFCGRSCAYTHGTKKESYRRTCLEKYGVEHPMQAEEVVAKVKATNIDRYGTSNPMSWTGEKFLSTIEQLHGTRVVRHFDGVHEKITETKKKKTGELLVGKVAELEKLFEARCISELPAELQRIDELDLEWQHTCGRKWFSGISYRGIRPCPSCSSGTSRGEREVGAFLSELGLKWEGRRRDVIPPRELDIYLPEQRVAIEYDGTYWHSARFETRKRCLDKLERCEQEGIRLITLQEHLWVGRRELVKSRLRSILGHTDRAGARECKVVELDATASRAFLDEHHLQGAARATVHLGLERRGELLAVATFGAPRWSRQAGWELIRLAGRQGLTVQGGASKLLEAFRKKHTGRLISYADRCWSTGNVYQRLGFKFSHNTTPSYWWIHHSLGAFSRYQTQKAKLPRLLSDLQKEFYPELSEEDNMRLAGFLPIYDRGNSAWTLDG